MRFLIISIGTRGDMEPFLAIATLLAKNGHEVTCLFPEQFKELVIYPKIKFESLGPEFIELLDSAAGKAAMGAGSKWQKFFAYLQLIKLQPPINKKLVLKQKEIVSNLSPDKIIHHSKAMYPVIWGVKHPYKTILVSPVPFLHYVKGHSHLFFNSNFGDFFNKLTYKLADWGLLKTILSSAKMLGETGISKKTLKKQLKTQKVIYTISPQLFKRPKNWSKNLQILGYHERDKTLNWKPTKDLIQFLNNHKKVLFLTFGSMVNPKPMKTTELFLGILKKHKIPTIINTASGGFLKPSNFDSKLFYFVERIPYDWVLPKIHVIIHHGGSGTTHMALKNGCANMIIPHIIDQFVWNKLNYQIGAGPLGPKMGRLKRRVLESKILDLYKNPLYSHKAREIQKLMCSEDYEKSLYNALSDF